MSTVSTLFTHAISRQKIKITFITQCSEQCDVNHELENRFGLLPNSFLTVQIFRKKSFLPSATLFYLEALIYLIRKAGPTDIIYTRNSTFLPYLYIVKLFTKARAFFEAHGYHGNPEAVKRTISFSRYDIAEKLFLSKIDGICSLTEAMKKLFKKDFPDTPVCTLPLGVSVKSKDFIIDPVSGFSRRQLCYIGRYNDNIEATTVFKAISICKPHGIKLIWIGLTPSQKSVLVQLAESFEITPLVELLPWLGYHQMCHTVKKVAGAGLVAYKDSFDSNVQISPTKLFDFFSFGLPVLASDVGAVREITNTHFDEFLYQPGNAADLAVKIQNLFSSFKLYKKYCEESLKMADEFSWEKRAQKFLSFISTAQPAK
jgi:glycosyltransferase involved in cell wall biosynthesis